MAADWTIKEVQLIVREYFKMLELELENKKYNKAEFRRAILPLLDNRSHGSVEFKHQNISAILLNMGQPCISGYKPRFNYQHILEEYVAKFLKSRRVSLEKKFDAFANRAKVASIDKIDFDKILTTEPQKSEFIKREPSYRPIKINYLEKEQNNRNLGERGEHLVIEYEKWRLSKAGKSNLAERIEWVSKEKGDGLGFDILSKNTNGTDRYVEVKTTKLSKETPIYLTQTELGFSQKEFRNFYLYRVFDFELNPRLFIKNGPYKNYCTIIPMTFRGNF
jgi:hypothetical protein